MTEEVAKNENKTINITVERQKEEDIPEIENLLHITWLATYPNAKIGITKEDIIARHESRQKDPKREEYVLKSFRQQPKNVHSFVAKSDGRIIGYSVFVQREKSVQREKFDQLQAFYVLPEFQENGVGKAMWDEIKKMFVKGKKIIVQVADYNQKAIKYYEKLGFKDNGKRWFDPKFVMPISKKTIPEMEMEMLE